MNEQTSVEVGQITQEKLPSCDYCHKKNCQEGTWYRLLSGKLSFICFDCFVNACCQKSRRLQLLPIGYPIYDLRDGILKPIDIPFTVKLRHILASKNGKRIRFKLRLGKEIHRIQGKYRGIFHKPEKGFEIELNHVVFDGKYCGLLRFVFPLKDIIWEREVLALLSLPANSARNEDVS